MATMTSSLLTIPSASGTRGLRQATRPAPGEDPGNDPHPAAEEPVVNDPVLSLTAASLAGRSDPHPPGSALVGSMEASIVVVVAVLLGFGGLALPAPALAAVLLGLSAAWLAVFLVAEARARRKWSSVP